MNDQAQVSNAGANPEETAPPSDELVFFDQSSPVVKWIDSQIKEICTRLHDKSGMIFSRRIIPLVVMEGWRCPNALAYYSELNSPHIVINGKRLKLVENTLPDGAGPWRFPFMRGQAKFIYSLLIHEALHDANRHNLQRHHCPKFWDLCNRAAVVFDLPKPLHPYENPRQFGHPLRWPHEVMYHNDYRPDGRMPRPTTINKIQHHFAASTSIPVNTRPFEPCTRRSAYAILPALMSVALSISKN